MLFFLFYHLISIILINLVARFLLAILYTFTAGWPFPIPPPLFHPPIPAQTFPLFILFEMGSQFVAQASPKLKLLLPQSLKC